MAETECINVCVWNCQRINLINKKLVKKKVSEERVILANKVLIPEQDH